MPKKLIYLDQCFLSDAWQATVQRKQDGAQSPQQRILEKVRQLKDRQQVFVVVSDVHSTETSSIPDNFAEKRAGLWALENELADGVIADNPLEVFLRQQRRMLQNPLAPETFPPEDIGLKDPYRYRLGTRVILTNTWRGRLHKQTATARNEVNAQLRAILERQASEIGKPNASQDCLAHVHQQWRKDLLEGISAQRQQMSVLANIQQYLADPTRMPGQIPEFPSAPFKSIVMQIVQGLGNDALDDLEKLLAQDPTGGCACVRLRSAFEAEVLWSWCSSDRTGPNFKDTKFGLSRLNDINHISTYLPYVDVLTTDNEMARLCQRGVAKKNLNASRERYFRKKPMQNLTPGWKS